MINTKEGRGVGGGGWRLRQWETFDETGRCRVGGGLFPQRCQNRVELLNFKMEDLRGLGHAGWGMWGVIRCV